MPEDQGLRWILYIVGLGLFVSIIALCREIVTWWFKLNEIVSLLKSILAELKDRPRLMAEESGPKLDISINGQDED